MGLLIIVLIVWIVAMIFVIVVMPFVGMAYGIMTGRNNRTGPMHKQQPPGTPPVSTATTVTYAVDWRWWGNWTLKLLLGAAIIASVAWLVWWSGLGSGSISTKDVSDRIAELWRDIYPVADAARRLTLSAAVVLVAFWLLKGIPTLKEFGEMAAAVGAIIFGAYVLLYAIWNYDGSRHEYASVSPPEVASAAVLAPNTSRDCPGNLSELEPLTEEVTFNPKGCYFYALGKGTIEFSGLFISPYKVDLETGRGSQDGHKVSSASPVGGPVTWQYILCAGPKRNMQTLDCS